MNTASRPRQFTNGCIPSLAAVHGLDGHWETTWTADNGVSLLHDLLPKAIPNLRILTWGYDDRTYGSSLSCQTFHDHALALITDLTARPRETNVRILCYSSWT